MEKIENELKKEFNETTEEKNLQIDEPQNATEKATEETQTEKTKEETKINGLIFCGAITEAYTKISDFVFCKIKKTTAAPKWENETKETIKAYLAETLESLNISVSKPYYGLLVVLIFTEFQRYTAKNEIE